MQLSTLLSIIIVPLQANVLYQISNVKIESQIDFCNLWESPCTVSSKCPSGSELEYHFYPFVESAGYYIDMRDFGKNWANTGLRQVGFSNVSTFSLPPANGYSLSALILLYCRGIQLKDYLVLRAEDKDSYNDTWPNSISRRTSNYNLDITLNFNRSCDNQLMFGIRCEEPAQSTNNSQYCYLYNNGVRICCDVPNVDQVTCAWTNSNCVNTTISPYCEYCDDDKSKENLYFWLMIGFAILSGILILLLLFCLLLMCMKKDKKQTIAPIYVQPARAEVIESRRPSERRRPRSRGEVPPYPSYRASPTRRQYREDPRGSFQMEYDLDDDNSLRDEWVEPMPRRVAKQTAESRFPLPREPRDAVV